MPDPWLILKASAVAAVLAAAIMLLAGWPWRRPHAGRVAAGGALGVGAGFCVGAWLLGLAPALPPQDGVDRLLVLLLPAVVGVEAAAGFLSGMPWLWWLLRLALAAAAAPVLLHGSIYTSHAAGPGTREWLPEQMVLTLGGLAAALAMNWVLLDRLAQGQAGRGVALALALTAAGAGVTVMLSGYATGGQLGFPLAAVLAAAVIASLALAEAPDLRGTVGVSVMCLFALLAVGRFLGSLSTANAGLLFFAPQFGWLAELPLVTRVAGPRLRSLARLALAATPVAIVLALAVQHFIAASRPPAVSPRAKEASVDDYMNFGK